MADFPSNPTQLIGLLAFGGAALACALRAVRGARHGWRALASLHLLFAAEVLLGWRHRAHWLMDAALQARSLYESRFVVQRVTLALLALAGLIVLLVLVRRLRRDAPLLIAALASGVEAALFLIETISLHATDALLYRTAGPVLSIGWLWLTFAGTVAFCAARARRARFNP